MGRKIKMDITAINRGRNRPRKPKKAVVYMPENDPSIWRLKRRMENITGYDQAGVYRLSKEMKEAKEKVKRKDELIDIKYIVELTIYFIKHTMECRSIFDDEINGKLAKLIKILDYIDRNVYSRQDNIFSFDYATNHCLNIMELYIKKYNAEMIDEYGNECIEELKKELTSYYDNHNKKSWICRLLGHSFTENKFLNIRICSRCKSSNL